METMTGKISAAVPVFRVASVAPSVSWYSEILGFAADSVGPEDDPAHAARGAVPQGRAGDPRGPLADDRLLPE